MKNFNEFKQEVIKRCKEKKACEPEFKKILDSENENQLIEILVNNINWCYNNIFDEDFLKEYSEILNNGKYNSGIGNSGDLNSGDLNSGDRNSGYRNSGYRNSGDRNSGDRNSGGRNSGDRNSGDRNSGDRNSGDRNSGDLNSGYRNSGVFCNKKKEDTIVIFNKKTNWTWNDWYNSKVYDLSFKLEITKLISYNNMNDEEKKTYEHAYVCDGYLKTYSYKEAWSNLWNSLNDEEKNEFKKLPNFDSKIFKDITGIKL